MNYVYGPVPSRRLGQSLGIDPIPLKTCNWNCVYCQLGRSRPMVNRREDYFPPEAILEEVKQALSAHKEGEIDWVTFVGSGEPTLHASLGWLIRQVKAITDLPVGLITNGALLYRPEVREEVSAADAVMPTLDAGSPDLYRKISRPHPEFTFERLLNGLTSFRDEYDGHLWVEIMLIRGLNDTEAALRDIAAALRRIRPDQVHITQPTRPPVETWVQPPSQEGLLRARAILGEITKISHPSSGAFDLSGYDDVVDAILSIISRHPIREQTLICTVARWFPEQAKDALHALEASGRAQVVERYGVRFWSASPSYYPAEENVH
jgi:wyosine [tRNA(Phe)-imidazoG37] synthetase (radical SAM superfamily)